MMLVGFIQAGMVNRGMALASTLNVDGAFNGTPIRTCLLIGMTQRGVSTSLVRWIGNMLNIRNIETSWGLTQKRENVKKGYPQGGMFSPTAWFLVIVELLRELHEAGI